MILPSGPRCHPTACAPMDYRPSTCGEICRVFILTVGAACLAYLTSQAQDAAKPCGAKPERQEEKARGVLARLADGEAKTLPLQRKLQEALRGNDLEAAEKVCRQWIKEVPEAAEGRYDLAWLCT
jgi:hypothetical protein